MFFIKSPSYNAQFSRTLGYIASGGAELSECFSLQKKLNSSSVSWYQEWRKLADDLKKSADESPPISSGEKLLRCSNYYRTAYFFLEEDPSDPRIIECLELSKQAFAAALIQLKIPHIQIQIPFGDTTLPGYLYPSNISNAPLLIDMGGGDSMLEELYFISGAPALKRGVHCLTFEGPGQGSVLRTQGLPFQFDSEKVVSAVIDFMRATFPEMSRKIALRGDSFGGYLAARAAVYEKRLSGCILNPGIVNAASGLDKLKSGFLRRILFFLKPDLRFKIESRYMRFGAKSFPEMMEACQKFDLSGLVDQITCPTLVIDNEDEHLTKGEAVKLYAELKCPKTYYNFRSDQSSGGHCQPFAQFQTQELIFDWLERTLKG